MNDWYDSDESDEADVSDECFICGKSEANLFCEECEECFCSGSCARQYGCEGEVHR